MHVFRQPPFILWRPYCIYSAGYLTGAEDYLTHKRSGFLDLHDNLDPVFNETGHYSAQLFTQKASDVIMAHDSTKVRKGYVRVKVV